MTVTYSFPQLDIDLALVHLQACCLDLTHLCFADDLFVMAGATLESFTTIKDVLDDFGAQSRLFPNLDKSCCYFGNTKPEQVLRLQSIMRILIGSLPAIYLGVPLCNGMMRKSECRELVDKIKATVNGWSHKNISCAGRVSLIQSVFFGISNYWAQSLYLPTSVCDEIDKIVRSFLWSGASLSKCSAKVSWDEVCRRKENGGLGIKSMQD